MRVTIHQPDFLPWLGFFDRWKNSDLYIILDDVQFLRRGWHHRDKIKTKDGARWLTVPVTKKGRYEQLIRDVEIDNSTDWRTKHIKTIEVNYKKAPNFNGCFGKIEAIYGKNHSLLIDLNMDLLRFIAEELKITTPVKFSSDCGIETASTQKLIDLVRAEGAAEYLTGIGSGDYLDESLFEKAGISVVWQEFSHPVYKQLHGEFLPMLSSLDYLMMRDRDAQGGTE
ncbi:MAG: WbqC family protein [Candidatus Omnitrophica bacterium]|nr:WbqC family protein [Candidatus Omnitrophota bacterium]